VYSGVPAAMVGREQEIEVGFMSGASNVSWWLARRGIPADPTLVQAILHEAKERDRILSEDEILALCRRSGTGAARAV
jgi:2-isopropylmalate synthase